MRQVGLDPDTWLEKPVDDIRIRSLIKKLLEKASSYYQVSAEAIFYFLRIAEYQYCPHAIFTKKLEMS